MVADNKPRQLNLTLMKLSRRQFFAGAALATATTTLPRSARAQTLPPPPQPARLRLSCQEKVAPGETLAEKLDFLEAHGFEGIEPGGGGLSRRVEEFQKALAGRRIKISAICAGFEGVLISEQEEVRAKAMRSMKEILTAAGALGSVGMIMVPAFHNQTKLGTRNRASCWSNCCRNWANTRTGQARKFCSNRSTGRNAIFSARSRMPPPFVAMPIIPAWG